VTKQTLLANGSRHEIEVDADTPLLWVLRDTLGLTGTKFGYRERWPRGAGKFQ
jgi:aerobic-type carbon monoxide dehydrogenase small subunit (CoxS/CutS family)